MVHRIQDVILATRADDSQGLRYRITEANVAIISCLHPAGLHSAFKRKHHVIFLAPNVSLGGVRYIGSPTRGSKLKVRLTTLSR